MITQLPKHITIASRASRLALCQTEMVKNQLQKLYPKMIIDILPLSTKGDEILDRSLSTIGGKGLFIKELEIALKQGKADMAVHSMKDVPMELPQGFVLAASLLRENPFDAFVSNQYTQLSELPKAAIIGTSSLRRTAFLKRYYPDLVVKSLRGNLDTRLAKLDAGEYAAIVLAGAGLLRLQKQDRIRHFLSPEEFLPAAGQGAITIEVSVARQDMLQLLSPLNHYATQQAVSAERAVCKTLGGGCHLPIAAFANVQQDQLQLSAAVMSDDGKQFIHAQTQGHIAIAEKLGQELAQALIKQGACDIIQSSVNPSIL